MHLRPEPAIESARSVLDSIRRIVRGLRIAGRACERDLGLGGAQLFILQRLRDGEPVSISDLSERTLTDQSSVSVVVAKLVERGLVARVTSKEDARRAELSLTPAGRELLGLAPTSAQENIIEAVLKMPPAESRRLAELLEVLVKESGLDQGTAELIFEEKVERKKRFRRPGKRNEKRA